MKYIFLFLVFITSNLFSEEYAHQLSVCAIFQNDSKYLPEWIEFHMRQGVTHFYLYDNLSTDSPRKKLKKYEKHITYCIWPYSYTDKDPYSVWNSIQCNAYMDCIKKYKDRSKWIAFIDTD